MVSRVFFSLEIEGKRFTDLYVDIKQLIGSDFEASPLEVSAPHGYSGPFNHEEFRDAVENYYRSLVGASGSGINSPGGANIRMSSNIFLKEASTDFEVNDHTVDD